MTRRRSAGAGLIGPATVLILAGFLAPTVIMAMLSLRDYSGMQGIGTDWTLSNYIGVLGDWFYLEIILRTLALGLGVTLLCLVIGFPLALFIGINAAAGTGLGALLCATRLGGGRRRRRGWRGPV